MHATLAATDSGLPLGVLQGFDSGRPAPPNSEAPAEWMLLTTLDVRTAEDAAETVGFHLQRWRMRISSAC